MKKYFIPIIVLITAVLYICSSVACGTKNVPPLENVSQYSEEELSSLAKSVTQNDLTNSWGEAKHVNNLLLWQVPLGSETKYVTVSLENGSVMSISVSFPLFVTVVEVTDTEAKGLVGWENYTKDSSALTVLPSQDVFGNTIPYELGDLYYFQFDGNIMETYPAQIRPPYSATRMGTLPNEELSELTSTLQEP